MSPLNLVEKDPLAIRLIESRGEWISSSRITVMSRFSARGAYLLLGAYQGQGAYSRQIFPPD